MIEKGTVLNPKGRPKGSVNISTLEKRGLVEYIKNEGADRFLLELGTLEGEKYCKIYKDVIEIAFPKLARHEVTGKDGKDLIPNPILGGIPKDNSDREDTEDGQEG